jgi:hypothetical protein
MRELRRNEFRRASERPENVLTGIAAAGPGPFTFAGPVGKPTADGLISDATGRDRNSAPP